jgi:GH25 family lysozyme M1 (1,4-beta-N-acetylmuramidase)
MKKLARTQVRLVPSVLALAVGLTLGLALDACDEVPPGPRGTPSGAMGSSGLHTETTWSALKVCAGPETVPGIDVSKWQGEINWKKVADAGYKFANIRVSNGTTLDPYFVKNRAGAKANGIIPGAYHFFQPDIDPAKQADFVVSHVGMLPSDELPVTLDLEWADGGTPTVSAVQTWMNIVTAGTGKVPMIYTSAGYWNPIFNSEFKKHPLWVAHWGTECPNLPEGWSEWWFWQPGGGPVPGVPGDIVDMDKFNGNLQDLKNFATGSVLSGCQGPKMVACGKVGCGCADGECSGVFCPGTGCSAQETANCAAYGCLCADHQCSGGMCDGTGCTVAETIACTDQGCDCKDHQCSGGACVPCQPTCEGKACGPDGCGGSCGECPEGISCNQDETGTSAWCGDCPPGQVCAPEDVVDGADSTGQGDAGGSVDASGGSDVGADAAGGDGGGTGTDSGSQGDVAPEADGAGGDQLSGETTCDDLPGCGASGNDLNAPGSDGGPIAGLDVDGSEGPGGKSTGESRSGGCASSASGGRLPSGTALALLALSLVLALALASMQRRATQPSLVRGSSVCLLRDGRAPLPYGHPDRGREGLQAEYVLVSSFDI